MTRQNSASGNRNFRWEGCNDDSVDSGRGKGKETVRLQLSASPAEIGEAFASLDRISLDATATTILDVSSNVPGVYRRLYDVNVEDGHQPLVFENHGIDARYTGPHSVAPTMSARYGTGGNNVPLVAEPDTIFCITGNAIDRQPMNGGNGIGYQQGIAYTLTATDHHAVFSRQRVDVFKSNEVVSTQSARQHKDATDLVVDMDEPDNSASAPRGASVLLIRRLTPLECERLQGFPDGWTDIEGASDSARYKALGNSVAIPCVDYVLQGIAWATTAQTA